MATDTLPMPLKSGPIAPAQRGFTGLVDIVQHLGELWDLGKILVESRMLPQSISSPNAAVAIMLKGHELGIGPMHAFDGISVIQGKPTISPQLMQALVERSGLLEDIRVEETTRPAACRITLTRRGRSPQTIAFDQDEAQAMGLWGKGNWAKMPAVMLYWRCVAKAYRRVFPDVIAGCYTPDEMGADVNEEGEILEAEVVQVPPKPPVPTAKGLFSKEHTKRTQDFAKWLGDLCRAVNADWHDGDGKEHGWEGWKSRLARALDDGLEVPEKVHDFMPYQKARGHLWKWAIERGYLTFEPGVDVEEAKTRQIDAYVAFVGIERFKEMKAELADYIAREREKACDAIYRKHPDLAPMGYGEVDDEPAVAEPGDKGDAYEDDLLDEALAN